ncbi:hypothetical protein [Acidithiobacillus acidisediminis]|uniref:hypothetical protein n=1 Tax=Acidithiobacillus acidisediminis TaxID=2937799 RepID=UPI00200C382C|nr:hypothetical protein [Acidithiobacillus sp. S30A2]
MDIQPSQAIDIFDLYKPFRNAIRELALPSSLKSCWEYQKYADVSGVIKLSTVFGPGRPSFEIYIWELHILCREILLHANGTKNTLSTADGLVKYINKLRKCTEGISARTIKSADRAMQELFLLAHQQARWQHSLDQARIFRAYHIYSDHDLCNTFYKETGISMTDMTAIALTVGGITKDRIDINSKQDYSVLGIRPEVRDNFFKMTSKTIKEIRNEITRVQRYDQGWPYTWNPLEAYPLIDLQLDNGNTLWCPLPELLSRRITEGLFYDLRIGNGSTGAQYGKAFEHYVGKVITNIFPKDKFRVSGEHPYNVKGQIKHGVDWIISDDTGNLFIECKTRRLRHEAKELANGNAVKKSFEELADAVVQLYRNIDDAISGKTKWNFNHLQNYPFIITYEDWYISTPVVEMYLIESVKEKLLSFQMSTKLIESTPFFIVSIAEFEKAGQAISHLGIRCFCTSNNVNKYRLFKLSRLAFEEFPNVKIPYRLLFQETWADMFPNLKHLLDKIPPAGLL